MIVTEHEVSYSTDSVSSKHREYHLKVPIKASHFWDAGTGEHFYGREKPPMPALLVTLTRLRGINSFYTNEGYTLKVRIAEAYQWDSIHPAICSAIAEHDRAAAWPSYDKPADAVEVAVKDDDDDSTDITA